MSVKNQGSFTHAKLRQAVILATGSFLPHIIVSNNEVISRYGHGVAATAVEKVYGVKYRRIADSGLADSDLLAQAARCALTRAGRSPEDLSKMIVTKFLGDRLLPMTASLTQKKLGTSMAFQAFDIDGGVNSFMQAMEAAIAAIAMGDDLVLVASGGINNRLVNREDPRQAFLYGDGAGAVLLGVASPGEKTSRIEAVYQLSNCEIADFARAFEMRKKITLDIHETKNYASLFDLYEGGDWKSVQGQVLDLIDRVACEVLARAGMTMEDMDLFLLTENNHRLWCTVLDHLGVTRNKTMSIIAEYGNTMSAMLPLLLDRCIAEGRLKRGQRVLMLSVGEGLSCSGLVITY